MQRKSRLFISPWMNKLWSEYRFLIIPIAKRFQRKPKCSNTFPQQGPICVSSVSIIQERPTGLSLNIWLTGHDYKRLGYSNYTTTKCTSHIWIIKIPFSPETEKKTYCIWTWWSWWEMFVNMVIQFSLDVKRTTCGRWFFLCWNYYKGCRRANKDQKVFKKAFQSMSNVQFKWLDFVLKGFLLKTFGLVWNLYVFICVFACPLKTK